MRRQLSDYGDVDHESVPDHCEQCGCALLPDERDLCVRCREDYYREKDADERYDHGGNEAA